MKKNARIEWIDYAKVFGIWLVIFGHLLNDGRPIERELVILIYGFHMPFFFFVSGLLFHTKQMSFKEFFKSKVKSLIIPYILLNLLCAVISIPIYFYPSIFPTANLNDPICDVSTLFDGQLGSRYSPPSWFLVSLFCSMILTYFVSTWKTLWQVVIVVCAIVATYIVSVHKPPLGLDVLPGSFVFFFMGCKSQGGFKDKNIQFTISFTLLTMVSIAIYVILSLYNGQVAINNIIGTTGYLFWIVAIIGILAMYFLSLGMILFINRTPHIHTYIHTYIQRAVRLLSLGTIIILSIHEMFINYTIDFFLVNHSFHIPLVLREVILSTLILFVCIPVIWVVKRYLPILIGYRK